MNRQAQIEADAKETINKLSNLVNGFNDQEVSEALSECVMREHRTLQQSMMRFFAHQIKVWSETEHYDLRNEGTIMLCKKIMKEVGEDSFLPYV